jgi:phosphoglycolate phosphatase
VREIYGLDLEREPMARVDHAGETAIGSLRKLLRAEGLGDDAVDSGLEEWVEAFSRHYLESLANADTGHWQLAPGTVATLERLAEQHHLALLTGNPEPMARARLERLGLTRFFPDGQGAFGSDGERRADLIELARERAGGWPARKTVLVGDTPRDVAGAHEARAKAVGVTTGAFAATALRAADVVLDSLAELPAALKRLESAP